nr:histone-lysine N-methyltransferase ATX2-like isoform X1 [Tanacetum cinerariifolium]
MERMITCDIHGNCWDVDRLQVVPLDENEENQCIRLLSFCKRHGPNRSIERVAPDERMEPYDIFGRRGRKELESLAAASLKRVYVENRPYLVGGFCQHNIVANINKNLMLDAEILFMSENIGTVLVVEENVKRKSAINGFGIFAKQPHKAGDMVIEYTGESVRPSIADRREHLIYNCLEEQTSMEILELETSRMGRAP